jgi:hypothetical protein
LALQLSLSLLERLLSGSFRFLTDGQQLFRQTPDKATQPYEILTRGLDEYVIPASGSQLAARPRELGFFHRDEAVSGAQVEIIDGTSVGVSAFPDFAAADFATLILVRIPEIGVLEPTRILVRSWDPRTSPDRDGLWIPPHGGVEVEFEVLFLKGLENFFNDSLHTSPEGIMLISAQRAAKHYA